MGAPRTSGLPIPERAILIDADQVLRRLVENYLQSLGTYTIAGYASGDEAMSDVLQNPVDLIVMDWKMKNPEGLIMLDTIRSSESNANTPVIMISGFITKQDVTQTNQFGNCRFLVKPFAEEVFIKLFHDPNPGKKKGPNHQILRGDRRNSGGKDIQVHKSSGSLPGDKGLHLVKNEAGTDPGNGLYIDKKDRPADAGSGMYIDKKDRPADTGSGIYIDKREATDGGDFETTQQREKFDDGKVKITRERTIIDDLISVGGAESLVAPPPAVGVASDDAIEAVLPKGVRVADQPGPALPQGGTAAERQIGVEKGVAAMERAIAAANGIAASEQELAKEQGVAGSARAVGRAEGSGGTERHIGTERGVAAPEKQLGTEKGVRGEDRYIGTEKGVKSRDRTIDSENGARALDSRPAPEHGDGATGAGNVSGLETETLDTETGSAFESIHEPGNALMPASGELDPAVAGGAGTTMGIQTPDDMGLDLLDMNLLDDGKAGTGESIVSAERPASHSDNARPAVATIELLGKTHTIRAPGLTLITDSDPALAKITTGYLNLMGTTAIELARDGVSAWELIRQRKFDLIILDWGLQKLSSLCIYNRLRSRPETATTPVIVTSGTLSREELKILGESSHTYFIRKPAQLQQFQAVLKRTLTNAYTYDYATAQIKAKLKTGDNAAAVALLTQAAKEVPTAYHLLIASARYFAERGDTKTAETMLTRALSRDPGSVAALTELSRIYHMTHRSHKAHDLLQKAYQISPDSIERLCLMGEVGLTLKNTDAAARYFKEALAIDKDHAKSRSGLTLAENLGEYLGSSSSEAPAWLTFASMLNTVGVSMVRAGKHDKGIEQYRAAAAFIQSNETLARLHFNLGLGYMRKRDLQNALPWLESAHKLMPGGFAKARKYADRAQQILKLENVHVGDLKVAEHMDIDLDDLEIVP